MMLGIDGVNVGIS